MLSSTSLLLLAGASLIPRALAHSRILSFVIDNALYEGYDFRIPSESPVLAAWSTSVEDDGWVNYESYAHPDIICHRDAANAKGHAPVAAGDTIDIQWQGWPESHKGPILTYLAYCGDGLAACESVDKTDLEFFLIDEHGLINAKRVPSPWATGQGTWASDEFIRYNSSWVVQIPEELKAGSYVLRQEWIALHYALDLEASGPQHYPQCINLEISGDGDERPEGVKGIELYHHPTEEEEPGLAFDISTSPLAEYVIPGPTLWESAVTDVEQTSSVVTSTATAVPGAPEIILERDGDDSCTPSRAMRRGDRNRRG